jgi:hypothetical protein
MFGGPPFDSSLSPAPDVLRGRHTPVAVSSSYGQKYISPVMGCSRERGCTTDRIFNAQVIRLPPSLHRLNFRKRVKSNEVRSAA